MARIWKEPCTQIFGVVPAWIFYVHACGFTFRFSSTAGMQEYIDHFNQKTWPSGRAFHAHIPPFGRHEYLHTKFQRLPGYLREESKRREVVKALERAIVEFRPYDAKPKPVTAREPGIPMKSTGEVHPGQAPLGGSALHAAAYELDAGAVQRLLGEGLDVNALDDGLETPLHFAAWKQSSEVAELLLRAGADVNAEDQYGMTPLWSLFRSMQWHYGIAGHEVLQLLLSYGANPFLRNSQGVSPVEVAQRLFPREAEMMLSSVEGAKF